MNRGIAISRPTFSAADAERIALETWNLKGAATELGGDRDQNFALRTEAGRYVLKFASAAESRESLQLQNAALEKLAGSTAGIQTPKVALSRDGNALETATDASGRKLLARMVSWLDGALLAEVTPHSDELLHSLGETLGAMDVALTELEAGHRPELRWDLQQAFAVFESCAACIEDPGQRALHEHYVTRFRTITRPRLETLRQGWIHNDANDYNVVVREDTEGQQVVGLIDFGDMVYSWQVSEVAIACAYAMLEKPNPLAAAKELVRGYNSQFALHEDELAVLFDLICMRLCMSVAICAEQKRDEPDNEYLSVSEAPAWALLQQLRDVSPYFATCVFRDACRLEPCEKRQRILQWFNSRTIHKLVDLDLHDASCFVHDLSVTSSEPATLAGTTDPVVFDQLLTAERARHGKSVGIGRYNEPRLCYQSDQFNSGDESRRTIHIGLDIFAPAGTTVFAPISGVVHSVANNDKLLDYGPTIILRHETDDGTDFYTLYGHLGAESVEHLSDGDVVTIGDPIATFGGHHENGGWPPHLHFQFMTDALDLSGDFPGVADPDDRAVWLSLCPDPTMIALLSADARCVSDDPQHTVDRREQVLSSSLSLSYRKPLKIVRGSGTNLFDECGRALLDTVNNVAHVGHCHPHVVATGQRQLAVLNTNTRYLHDSIIEYSERLTRLFPSPLDGCFLVCSGSEATELAMRLARAHTGGSGFVALDSGYHGNTSGCLDLSAYKFNGPGGSGCPPHVQLARTADSYRIPEFASGTVAAADVKAAFERLDRQAAAFLVEANPGCGGQIFPADDYLSHAYNHARAVGAVCIADEVQTGFGRIGSHFWAYEQYGVLPDIVTLGKPIGNGHPLSAVVTTRAIAESFANGMEYFNTFGGNAVSCEIGMAVLDVIHNDGMQEHAAKVGAELLEQLAALKAKHPLIGNVRGAGFFIGVELVRDRITKEPAAAEASYISNRMKRLGILTSTDGPLHNVIKFKPPMTFTSANATRYAETLDRILGDSVLRRRSTDS